MMTWGYPFDSDEFDEFLADARSAGPCPDWLVPEDKPDVVAEKLVAARAEVQQLRETLADLLAAREDMDTPRFDSRQQELRL